MTSYSVLVISLKKLKNIFVSIISVLLLSSCSSSIKNPADELTLNTWCAEFPNSTVMTLKFSGDKATLIISREDIDKVVICGLCEVSDSVFVIHDERTNTPYSFKYNVNFDRIDVVCDTNTVSFDKK